MLLRGGLDVIEYHRDIALLPTERRANGRAVWRTNALHDGYRLWLYFANNAKWYLDVTFTPAKYTSLALLTKAQSRSELLPSGSVPWQLGRSTRGVAARAGPTWEEGELTVLAGSVAQAV